MAKKNFNPPGQKIGGMLESYLEKVDLKSRLEVERLFEAWNEAVGAEMAKMARPLRFERGVLWVNVTSSVHLHFLSTLEKPRLLRTLAERVPASNIQNIVFRLG